MANEIVETSTTETGRWLTWVSNETTSAFSKIAAQPTEYQLRCAKEVFEAVKNTIDTSDDMENLLGEPGFQDNLAQVFSHCASLELSPAKNEIYFTFRKLKLPNGQWTRRLEYGIQGAGYETLVATFGDNVQRVLVPWEVMDTDEFEYPEYVGLEVTPPKWKRHPGGKKHILIVYPVVMNDGSVEYAIAERDDAMISYYSHIRQNLMSVTFGIAPSRFKATDEQKKQIDAKKREILDALKDCNSIDEMIAVESAKPYASPAWIDTPESMIVRKMKNKALKKFKLNFNTMQKTAMSYTDDSYKVSQAEIAENENSETLIIDGEMTEFPD